MINRIESPSQEQLPKAISASKLVQVVCQNGCHPAQPSELEKCDLCGGEITIKHGVDNGKIFTR